MVCTTPRQSQLGYNWGMPVGVDEQSIFQVLHYIRTKEPPAEVFSYGFAHVACKNAGLKVYLSGLSLNSYEIKLHIMLMQLIQLYL